MARFLPFTLILAFYVVTLFSCLIARPLMAQPIGIAAILNPEGSRLFPQSIIFPRHPGKPDPRWKNFNWQYVDFKKEQTSYRLYFYEEEAWTAQFTAPLIAEHIQYLGELFNYYPTQSFSYLLFGSLREFQQANIFSISEGVQGITSTEEASMAIPYWGDVEAFRHVSTHELVHQFQVQKLNTLAGATNPEAFSLIPLWFIEGMSEYYSLRGMDAESRVFIRDLLLHPDEKNEHKVPKFFDPGPMNFIQIYKMGQARIDFLETQFGKGTTQRIFETAAKQVIQGKLTFEALVLTELKTSVEELEAKWKDYLNRDYGAEAAALKQPVEAFEEIEKAGENLDEFEISPDQSLIAIREIDPLIGTTSVSLINVKKNDKMEIVRDQKPDLLTLFFMQFPILALRNDKIAFIVGTAGGPELEIRNISRDEDGDIDIGRAERIYLHKYRLVSASSPTFDPSGKKIAFIGQNNKGWLNVYVIDLANKTKPEVKQITNNYYAWSSLEWTNDGILAASDRTANSKFGVFLLNADTADINQLTVPLANNTSPSGTKNDFIFISLKSETPQIHRKKDGKEQKLTEIKTGFVNPLMRSGNIYALAFKTGKYHLYRIPEKALLNEELAQSAEQVKLVSAPAWRAKSEPFLPGQVQKYRPFSKTSGIRLDGLGGFFSTGGVGGLSGTVSDLMRNYSVSGEFAVLGDIKYTDAYGFFTSQAGRTTWTSGAYHSIQPRLDGMFPDAQASFIHREFGALGAIQYPLTVYSYLDLELRLGGVKRSEYSDLFLAANWERENPGVQFLTAPMVRVGYDQILYELYTGPIKGYGLLAEADTTIYPFSSDISERLRFDAAYYLKTFGRTVVATQLMIGGSFGGRYPNPFYISSDDILRAYPFFDDRLRGNYLLAGKVELRFPIGTFFRFPFLRGIMAYDVGTVTINPSFAGRNVTSSYTAGLGLNLPPIGITLMFSYPGRTAPGPVDRPITHFTLRYLYL